MNWKWILRLLTIIITLNLNNCGTKYNPVLQNVEPVENPQVQIIKKEHKDNADVIIKCDSNCDGLIIKYNHAKEDLNSINFGNWLNGRPD